MTYAGFIILEIMIATALYTDIRSEKIPNYIPAAGFLAGTVISITNSSIISSIKAFLIVSAIFLLMYAIGYICAGDVKFMMAASMLMGYDLGVKSIFFVILSGILISIAALVKKGILREVLIYSFNYLKNRIISTISSMKIDMVKPEFEHSVKMPYMPAIAIGINVMFIYYQFLSR